jgi:hypothetical protein
MFLEDLYDDDKVKKLFTATAKKVFRACANFV